MRQRLVESLDGCKELMRDGITLLQGKTKQLLNMSGRYPSPTCSPLPSLLLPSPSHSPHFHSLPLTAYPFPFLLFTSASLADMSLFLNTQGAQSMEVTKAVLNDLQVDLSLHLIDNIKTHGKGKTDFNIFVN